MTTSTPSYPAGFNAASFTAPESPSVPPLVEMVPGSPVDDPGEARAQGKELRQEHPLSAHDHPAAGTSRPTVEQFVADSQAGRLPHLLPLRLGKMAASPFAFYRGAAALMAADLADTPSSGLLARICGDAHCANFGLYGTPSRRVIIDINDFDEGVVGPWEWDLKRLCASLVIAGRESEVVKKKHATKAAAHAAKSYRRTVRALAELPFVESWSVPVDSRLLESLDAAELLADFEKAVDDASSNDSQKVMRKKVEAIDDHEQGVRRHRFVDEPPKLTHVSDKLAADVRKAVQDYVATLHYSRHDLLARYTMSDVAFRIVGTGSVGLQSYIILLHGNEGETLVLQMKEARESALAPYVSRPHFEHEGERIVTYARATQADTDFLMGWTTMRDVPFVVRQFRNLKGDLEPTLLPGNLLDDYARLAGALLAKAHCRSIHPDMLDGYLRGDGKDLDKAMAAFAVSYADQNDADYAEFLRLIDEGVLEADTTLND